MARNIIDIEATGNRIHELMKERNLSAKDIQKFLQLGSVQSVYAWISPNRCSMPTVDNLVLLRDLFELDSIDDILVIKSIVDNE